MDTRNMDIRGSEGRSAQSPGSDFRRPDARSVSETQEERKSTETPEDVAVLYSWANLHGAKYRDFSASRREYRAQMRHRAAEKIKQEAETKALEESQRAIDALVAAEAAKAAAASQAERAAVEAAAELAAQQAQGAVEAAFDAEQEEARAAAQQALAHEAAMQAEADEKALSNANSQAATVEGGSGRRPVVGGSLSDPYREAPRGEVEHHMHKPGSHAPLPAYRASRSSEPKAQPSAEFRSPGRYYRGDEEFLERRKVARQDPPGPEFSSEFREEPATGADFNAKRAESVRSADLRTQDRRAGSPYVADPRAAEGRAADQHTAEERAVDQRATEQRAALELRIEQDRLAARRREEERREEDRIGAQRAAELEIAEREMRDQERRDQQLRAEQRLQAELAQRKEYDRRLAARSLGEERSGLLSPLAEERPETPFQSLSYPPEMDADSISRAPYRAPAFGSTYGTAPSAGVTSSGIFRASTFRGEGQSFRGEAQSRGGAIRAASAGGSGAGSVSDPAAERALASLGRSEYAADERAKEPYRGADAFRIGGKQPEFAVPVGRPAWLYESEVAVAAARVAATTAPPLQAPGPALGDTLQQSRERVASRWFALKGVFEGAEQQPEVQPIRQKEARIPVLALFSLAGGVGKTSMVATLGRALASLGEKTLLADTTSYGLLPFYFGARELRPGAMRTFSPPSGSTDAPVNLINLDVEKQSAEVAAQGAPPSPDWLVEEITRNARGNNRIVVDLATASGALTRRILRMSPVVLVPVSPDLNSVISLSAAEQFFQTHADVDRRALKVFYVLNQFDASQPLHLDVREVLRQQLGDRLLPFVIRRSPAVSEALAEGMTVMDYAPNSPVAEDYMNLAAWVRSTSAPASLGFRGVRWSEQQ
ncbi:MAG: cellulose biosynthesis protein BcsQ [Acidobacteriaceae bacterium]